MGLRILAVLLLCLGCAAVADAPEGSIESFIDREMPAAGVPGLAYAVVADGQASKLGARGEARLGTGRKVSPDTPFLIGSISKSFTALAVMQLVEAGKVELDAKVSRYLAAFADRPASAISIRELLSHTSGFSTLQGNESHRDDIGGKDALARKVDRLAEVRAAYAPGERWEYSNINYQILGRLIEVVSGQEYQAYVAEHILQPVGMEHSFVADGASHPAMATGHAPWFGTKRPLADTTTDRGTAPQGGIIASASDLARYMRVMMNGADDVLSAEGKSQMMRPGSAASPFYGFGWFIDGENGSAWHSGSSPGVETLLTMVPAQKKGAVVLVNGGSGMGFGETAELRNGIAARALGFDYAGEESNFWTKATFVALAVLPFAYLASMAWAWRHRTAIRAKRSTLPGRFSLWFPLCV